MPIYEYACRGCGHRFELLVLHRSEEDGSPCPECGVREVERVMSTPAVSSDGTRRRNLAAAKKRGARSQQEKNAADHDAMRHYHEEH